MNRRTLSNARRHQLAAEYRRKVWAKYGIVPFPHQAQWICAGEGYDLLDRAPNEAERFELVMLDDESIEPRALAPRANGAAHVLIDLAGFKGGKSFGAAMWMCGYAALPDAQVDIIGLQYETSDPEIHYLAEFLLSEKGMGLKGQHRNNAKDGAVWVKLDDGAVFIARSWVAANKADSLKGKTRDCYAYSEAYQLPGLHVYSRVAQNLRERDGHAIFPTTPDRAWVKQLHDKGHGEDPYWYCVCGIDASCNPFTFDQAARDRDDPTKGGLMTKERFKIAWQGRVNRHIGAVYDYEKEPCMLTPQNYPHLWTNDARPPQTPV